MTGFCLLQNEDLFQSMPHLKEKLEAHMAKMSPEQRQWFAKNQSLVFAKLQHHHHLLLEQDKKDPPLLQQQPEPLASSKQQVSTVDPVLCHMLPASRDFYGAAMIMPSASANDTLICSVLL